MNPHGRMHVRSVFFHGMLKLLFSQFMFWKYLTVTVVIKHLKHTILYIHDYFMNKASETTAKTVISKVLNSLYVTFIKWTYPYILS